MISKAAAFNMTQSLRALLAGQGITVHAVVLGPIDTDMNRGFDIPKASPESAAQGIFDGLEKGEDDIFPTPRLSPSPRTGALAQSRRWSASSQVSFRQPWRPWGDVANVANETKQR